jgi:hypothetical protein
MLITQEMIWNRLNSLEKKIDKFLNDAQEASIEEISLNRAVKVLHLGNETIVHLVKSGKLEARLYRDKKRKIRYRFLLSDIKKFQKENKSISVQAEVLSQIESSEEIARRIFKNKAV